jgi:acetylornithine deacetylase/succinyl-diaminopimelate desuccinylase-like protein
MLDILVHLDVVDAGAGWETDPFSAVVRDGMLIGRGLGR